MTGVFFVNADIIASQDWPANPENHAYDAAEIAEATRSALIRDGMEFTAETVFSHPSKLELVDDALAAGYSSRCRLMVPEGLAVARVSQRVDQGGHGVPVTKIAERYQRPWANVAAAAEKASSAAFWDNSKLDGPLLVAELENGVSLGRPKWPAWTPAVLTERWDE